jgi:hypothetical protein
VDAIESALLSLEQQQQAFSSDFDEQKRDFDARHSEAVQQQAHLKSLIQESGKLVTELQSVEGAERGAASRLKAMEDAPAKLLESRGQLRSRLQARHGVLEAAAVKVQQMSGGSLLATVRTEELPKEHLDALLSLCDGHRIREVQAKCEDRVRNIHADAIGGGWERIIGGVMEAYRHKLQTGATSLDGSEAVSSALQDALLGPLTTQQLTSLYSALEVDHVVALLTATADSFVAFEYKDASGYIPFAQASEGQQAAALLELLLRQDAGTLIIDQPEEDLDNRVIMHIARLLQSTKQRRQLLFATHNPNFVVNGDADKVVVLHPGDVAAGMGGMRPRVSVEVDGAIETPAVRVAITDTMEGGREAFELRGRKYQF